MLDVGQAPQGNIELNLLTGYCWPGEKSFLMYFIHSNNEKAWKSQNSVIWLCYILSGAFYLRGLTIMHFLFASSFGS